MSKVARADTAVKKQKEWNLVSSNRIYPQSTILYGLENTQKGYSALLADPMAHKLAFPFSRSLSSTLQSNFAPEHHKAA